jgi:eukaryotic-like serine/threonine-protein kinase
MQNPSPPTAAAGRAEITIASPSSTAHADWSAVPDDREAGRLLLAKRVAYCGRVFFLLSLAFYVRNMALIAILEQRWPPFGHPALVLHVAAMLVALTQWLSCRSDKRSLRQLHAIDAAGLLGSMVLYGALTIAEAAGFEHAIAVESAGAEVLLVALIMMSFVVTRAIIVPAAVSRTFWLSASAAAICTCAAYGVSQVGFPADALARKPWLGLNQAMYVAMWGVFTVAVSTIAARVIHGLQQRVRDANEVGQYRLEEKIGEGGMGLVYRARHLLLRRPTALKLLPVERAGERAIRRFEQEVQLTSALSHPNTIAIYDFGRTPDGVFYYAMEYLDGMTFEQLVAFRGALPPARVVHLLKQVLGALAEAHALGLVHRDIKPANLMVCKRGGIPDHVKVLDFGLVKEQSAQAGDLSMAGTLLGTPAYLPPEALLHPTKVDGRSDLYAVGAVAYFLLSGTLVFDGRTLVEICAKHLHSEPEPLVSRTSSPVPESLERVVLRCLAKQPSDRPASATELIGLLDGVALTDSWSRDEAEQWWHEHGEHALGGAREDQRSGSTPGPLTVGVDLTQRAGRSAPAS